MLARRAVALLAGLSPPTFSLTQAMCATKLDGLRARGKRVIEKTRSPERFGAANMRAEIRIALAEVPR